MAARQSASYRAVRDWIASELPPPAGLPAGEERRQEKASILKPLNMRPDYGAVRLLHSTGACLCVATAEAAKLSIHWRCTPGV